MRTKIHFLVDIVLSYHAGFNLVLFGHLTCMVIFTNFSVEEVWGGEKKE